MDGVMADGVTAELHYQQLVPGKRVGRYINIPDGGELSDEHNVVKVHVQDGRKHLPDASLEKCGFELRQHVTACGDFKDSAAVTSTYYPEVEALVKAATGCESVMVFDHTIRETSAVGLNVLGETAKAAAPVHRVHTDYSDESAPKRLLDLAKTGSYTGRKLSEEEQAKLAKGRYVFINVWRSIGEGPALRCPLAVCDPGSIDYTKVVKYEMHYPDRVGSNFALEHDPDHKWYYYPKMVRDECLLFKVYEKDDGGAFRSVFHTAFDDPTTPDDAPIRRSIECRTIACF
mmetsp:Transcript_19526/g.45418  ORF Transcript_19526/g.45418 Transcript_19526/m.45418 type:complete len:288 (+) Transcript_19526:87-950(+)